MSFGNLIRSSSLISGLSLDDSCINIASNSSTGALHCLDGNKMREEGNGEIGKD